MATNSTAIRDRISDPNTYDENSRRCIDKLNLTENELIIIYKALIFNYRITCKSVKSITYNKTNETIKLSCGKNNGSISFHLPPHDDDDDDDIGDDGIVEIIISQEQLDKQRKLNEVLQAENEKLKDHIAELSNVIETDREEITKFRNLYEETNSCYKELKDQYDIMANKFHEPFYQTINSPSTINNDQSDDESEFNPSNPSPSQIQDLRYYLKKQDDDETSSLFSEELNYCEGFLSVKNKRKNNVVYADEKSIQNGDDDETSSLFSEELNYCEGFLSVKNKRKNNVVYADEKSIQNGDNDETSSLFSEEFNFSEDLNFLSVKNKGKNNLVYADEKSIQNGKKRKIDDETSKHGRKLRKKNDSVDNKVDYHNKDTLIEKGKKLREILLHSSNNTQDRSNETSILQEISKALNIISSKPIVICDMDSAKNRVLQWYNQGLPCDLIQFEIHKYKLHHLKVLINIYNDLINLFRQLNVNRNTTIKKVQSWVASVVRKTLNVSGRTERRYRYGCIRLNLLLNEGITYEQLIQAGCTPSTFYADQTYFNLFLSQLPPPKEFKDGVNMDLKPLLDLSPNVKNTSVRYCSINLASFESGVENIVDDDDINEGLDYLLN